MSERKDDDYDPDPPNHRRVNGERVSRIFGRDYASETTVYVVNNSEVFHADRDCNRIPDGAWPTAETLPEVMSSWLDPIKPCSDCTMDINHCAEVAVERDGLPRGQLKFYEPGDIQVSTRVRRTDDGDYEVTNRSERVIE